MHHESLAETISGSRQLRFQYQKLNVSVKEIKRGMVTCDNKNDLPKEAQYFTGYHYEPSGCNPFGI
jgi:hypothetical protein